jgi:hypothetical protein
MLGFDSLTSVTKGNIHGNVSLHPVPPTSGLEIRVHLIPYRMNRITRLVSLMKYLILQLLDVRYTNPTLVPQHTFIIIQETRQFFFLDVALLSLGSSHLPVGLSESLEVSLNPLPSPWLLHGLQSSD